MSQVELIFHFRYPSAFLIAESFSFFVVFVSFFTAMRPLSMSYSFDLSGKMCYTIYAIEPLMWFLCLL